MFPDAYYHVTALEVERLARGEFEAPIPKIEQLLAFFSAYQVNRAAWDAGTPVPDAHWRQHFASLGGSGATITDYQHALLTGMDAHIANDLPRALRATVDFPLGKNSPAEADFNATDATLRAASLYVLTDWGTAGGGDVLRAVATLFARADDHPMADAIAHRHAAWECAANARCALPTKDAAQPPTGHAELRQRWEGACGQ